MEEQDLTDEVRRSAMTTDEPVQVPMEEWDGMLRSKSKTYPAMYPLTPCMLTPYNTPHCNINSIKQRLLQTESITTTNHTHISNPIHTSASSPLPSHVAPIQWRNQDTPSVMARMICIIVAVWCLIPIVIGLVLCSPFLLFFIGITSPLSIPACTIYLIWRQCISKSATATRPRTP